MFNFDRNLFTYSEPKDFKLNVGVVSVMCDRRFPEVGDIYTHFKGKKVIVVSIALDSETCEPLIIYRHIDEDNCWCRKAIEFLAPVDKEKYPNVTQKYRFERELPLGITETKKYKETLELVLQLFDDMQLAHNYTIEHFFI